MSGAADCLSLIDVARSLHMLKNIIQPRTGASTIFVDPSTMMRPATPAAAVDLNIDRITSLERTVCSNFACCGAQLPDLHALLEHFEEACRRPRTKRETRLSPRRPAIGPVAPHSIGGDVPSVVAVVFDVPIVAFIALDALLISAIVPLRSLVAH
ncbi:hypothetical protein M413DRAFT_167243 [Hebeloma cylindrosporum]|uniref:Uncharacterized protein n=1 Tax=Hebeloma cylindrosporum TaxID=76867 RepID=A0A0C2YI67_HEBCY|nr:hypothetical protein M413DRAFT_167243 [Hebeloma cylindrosporum h7]